MSAFRALESAGTDMPLSWAERTVIGMFKDISDDNHPDAHACRLKLRLAMIYAPLSRWPVGSEASVMQDYVNYLSKISHVSFACRLSFEDELHLISHFRKIARKQKGNQDPIAQRPITVNREIFLNAAHVGAKTTSKRGSGGSDILRLALGSTSTKLSLQPPSQMKNGGRQWYNLANKLRSNGTATRSYYSSSKTLGFVQVGKASRSGSKIPNLWFANVTYGGNVFTSFVCVF